MKKIIIMFSLAVILISMAACSPKK